MGRESIDRAAARVELIIRDFLRSPVNVVAWTGDRDGVAEKVSRRSWAASAPSEGVKATRRRRFFDVDFVVPRPISSVTGHHDSHRPWGFRGVPQRFRRSMMIATPSFVVAGRARFVPSVVTRVSPIIGLRELRVPGDGDQPAVVVNKMVATR